MITDRLISLLLSQMVPPFVIDEYPTFANFLRYFFKYLEQHKQGYDIIANLLTYNDVDTTLDEFETLFKEQYAKNFPAQLTNPENNESKIALIVKNIRSFYKNKGTEDSFQFLFAALYGSNTQLSYPKQNILDSSDGWWYYPNYLVLEDENRNIPPQLYGGGFWNPPTLVGQYLTGVRTGATATVISAKQVLFPVDWTGGMTHGVDPYYVNTWAVEIDEDEGSFETNEMLILGGNYITNGDFLSGTASWSLRKYFNTVQQTADSTHFFEASNEFTIVQDASSLCDNYIFQIIETALDTAYLFQFSVTNWEGTLSSGELVFKIGYTENGNEIYDSSLDANVNPLSLTGAAINTELTGAFSKPVHILAEVPTIQVNVPVYITVYSKLALGNSVTVDGIALIEDNRVTQPLLYINPTRGLETVTVTDGGTGYAIGDRLVIDNGTDVEAYLEVATVNSEAATVDINLTSSPGSILTGQTYVTVPAAARWSDGTLRQKSIAVSGSTSDDGSYTITENIGSKIYTGHTFQADESVTVTITAGVTGTGYSVDDIINVRGGDVVGSDIAQLRVTSIVNRVGTAGVNANGSGYTIGDYLVVAGGTYSEQAWLEVTSIAKKASTINSIVAGGTGYTVSDVLTVNAGTGTSPEITVSDVRNSVDTTLPVTVVQAGSGYAVGDQIKYEVDAVQKFVLQVTSITGGGATGGINGVSVVTPGYFTTANKPANPVTMTTVTGTGTGATVDVSWLAGILYAASVTTDGYITSGYPDGNTLLTAGGTGSGATVVLNFTTGLVNSATVYTGGLYTVDPTTPNTPTGGTGTGATFDLTMEGGGITGVSIENPGTYTTPPTNPVFTYGGGAIFFMTWQDGDSVRTVDILHPGKFYTEVATPTNPTMDTGTGVNCEVSMVYTDNAILVEEGTWIDYRGWISEPSMKLRDNYFYQEFSYVIKSQVSVDQYRTVIKDNIHPAGLINFAIVQENEDQWEIDSDSTMHVEDPVVYAIKMEWSASGNMGFEGIVFSEVYTNPTDTFDNVISDSAYIFLADTATTEDVTVLFDELYGINVFVVPVDDIDLNITDTASVFATVAGFAQTLDVSVTTTITVQSFSSRVDTDDLTLTETPWMYKYSASAGFIELIIDDDTVTLTESASPLLQIVAGTTDGGTGYDFTDANPDTIVTSSARWGSVVGGDIVEVTNANNAANNGVYTVASATSTSITLSGGDALTTDADDTTAVISIHRTI